MLMLNISIVDFVLTSLLCYLCGIGSGCCWVTRNKHTFLQRERSVEDFSRYNHHGAVVGAPIMASAPHIEK
jgi:hypothetical protein